VPIQCEYYALEGLGQLLATLDLVRDHLNPHLALKGAVLTMFDSRTNLSAQVAADVRAHLGGRVYETVIPRSVRLSEAPSHGLPIHAYAPASPGARAYRALATELRRRDGRPQTPTANTPKRPGAPVRAARTRPGKPEDAVMAGAA
jgi:chromosome partitioning protein